MLNIYAGIISLGQTLTGANDLSPFLNEYIRIKIGRQVDTSLGINHEGRIRYSP